MNLYMYVSVWSWNLVWTNCHLTDIGYPSSSNWTIAKSIHRKVNAFTGKYMQMPLNSTANKTIWSIMYDCFHYVYQTNWMAFDSNIYMYINNANNWYEKVERISRYSFTDFPNQPFTQTPLYTDCLSQCKYFLWNLQFGDAPVKMNNGPACASIPAVFRWGDCWTIHGYSKHMVAWWRHQIETSYALLAFYAGNSPVSGEFPSQRPVTRSFDVFFKLRLSERLSKHSWGCWLKTSSRPLWRHNNVIYNTKWGEGRSGFAFEVSPTR